MQERADAYRPDEPLALIAGAGDLPLHIIHARQEAGQSIHIIALEKQTPKDVPDGHPHLWCRMGAVGQIMAYLQDHQITQVVMAGHMRRPSLKELLPDATGRTLLARLGGKLVAGDDRLLRAITEFIEEQGIRVVSPDAVCQELLAQEKLYTKVQPTSQQQEDCLFGIAVLQALASFDIGQAVIIQQGHVLGIEAMEGTAALIERCAGLREQKGGVLVKIPKVGQERRVDLPTIGPDTMTALAEHQYEGVCIAAKGTLLLGLDTMTTQANASGLFISGVTTDAVTT